MLQFLWILINIVLSVTAQGVSNEIPSLEKGVTTTYREPCSPLLTGIVSTVCIAETYPENLFK